MSTTGVNDKVSPITILFAISAKKGDAVWGTDQNEAGQRARIFNDVLKEESNKITADAAFLKRFNEMITGFNPPPLTEELLTKIGEEFDNLKKTLVEDPQWEVFWDTIRSRKKGNTDEPEFTEEDIQRFQVDVINGYRMKIFSLAQFDHEKKLNLQPNSDEVEKAKGKAQIFKDLILKVNIATREKAENETVLDYVQEYYKKNIGKFLMDKYSPNELIQEVAKQAKKDNLNDQQIRELVANKREELFQRCISVSDGDPKRVPYFKLNGDEVARKIFDELMPEETLFNKVKNVEAVNKLFDVDYTDIPDILKLDSNTAMVKSAFYQLTAPSNETMKAAQQDHFSTLLRESKDQVVGKLKTVSFSELNLSVEQAKAFISEIGVAQDKNGHTLLEAARISGKYTDAQYNELVSYSNTVDVEPNLNDPEQYAVMRLGAQKVYSDEYFQFDDELKRIESLTSEDEKLAAIKKLFDATVNTSTQAIQMGTGVSGLNMVGQGTPAEIFELYKKLQGPIDNRNTVTRENYQEMFELLKESGAEYRKQYFHGGLIPEGTEKYSALLKKPSPLHALLTNDMLNLPKDASVLNQTNINNKNVEGLTLLQLAQKLGKDDMIPELVKAGANPDLKTTDYKRSFFTRLTDTVKGLVEGKGLSQWKTPPERSVIEIAEVSGRKDIVGSIQNAVIERKETVSKEKTKQDNVLLSELESTMRVQPQSTPKKTVQPKVPTVDVTSNPLLIESTKPPTITPLLMQQRQKTPSDPAVSKYLEDINALLKEVEKAGREVDKSDTQEIRLIQVEKTALVKAKAVIEKSDLTSPEGKEDIGKKLQSVMREANNKMKEINHGMVMNSDLSGKRDELLSDIRQHVRSELSQPQKRGPSSSQRG